MDPESGCSRSRPYPENAGTIISLSGRGAEVANRLTSRFSDSGEIMRPVAYVKEIWRYPVKSMGGESVPAAALTATGLMGDRLWAVLDEQGEIKSARQWPQLIGMTARYADSQPRSAQLYTHDVPDVIIETAADGNARSRTEEANALLRRVVGKPCRLEPLRPPSATEFYTPPRERGTNLDVELDRQADEPAFDFSQTPAEMFELLGRYMTPPGTYFDSFPLHILSAQTMQHLAKTGGVDADRRRFRPNLLLDFVDSSLPVPEYGLLGCTIRIGETVISPQAKTIRCSIPSRPQPLFGLAQDPGMTRAMVRLLERHVGVYAAIEKLGDIQCGDAVFVDP